MTEMERQTAGRIAAFLDAHHVMSLATSGRQGSHAANVFYIRDGAALLWVSDRESRHSLDIENNPSVAATVAPDYSDIAEIQGGADFRACALDQERERARRRSIVARAALSGNETLGAGCYISPGLRAHAVLPAGAGEHGAYR